MFTSVMVRIFSGGERWNFRKMKDGMFNELKETFHLSPNENFLTIARIKTFIICFQ